MQSQRENRSLHLGVCLVSALAGYSGPAIAQNDVQETVSVATGLERDDAISWSEITMLREQVFERMDRNGDGVLSDQDQIAHSTGVQFGSALDNLRSHFDENGDREVSKQELIEAPSAAFSFGDSNGDGFLSESEMGAMRFSNDRQ